MYIFYLVLIYFYLPFSTTKHMFFNKKQKYWSGINVQIRVINIVLKYILLYSTFFTDPPDLIEGGSYIKPINVSQYNLC